MKKLLTSILLLVVVLGNNHFYSNNEVYAEESSASQVVADYYPTTNVITVVGEPVLLTKEITYLKNNEEIAKDLVDWEPIDETIFETPGKYEFMGITHESNQIVKGIVNVFDKGEEKVKIAAVGDSNTYGMGIANRAVYSYPKQLNYRLGDDYIVENYGNSGKTLLENGDDPYVRTLEYRNSLATNADVVVIQLGSNDSRVYNQQRIENFVDDYVRLINKYKETENDPVIYLALLPKIFNNGNYGNNNEGILKVLPLVMQAAREANLDVSIIDNYEATEEAEIYFPDNTHPNDRGASLLANNVYHNITGEKGVVSGKVHPNEYTYSWGIMNNGQTEDYTLDGLSPISWVLYEKVDFTNSTGQVQIHAAIPYDRTRVVLRKDSVDGEIVGVEELAVTGLYNYRYHTVDITGVSGIEDIYVSFERDGTWYNTEIARMRTIDFSYDNTVAFEVSTFEELETALNSGLTNIKLVDDIEFARTIRLDSDTKIDLNGHTLNTRGYYIGKDESIRKRIDLEIMNGHIEGTHINGSIYAADSLYDYAGFNIDIENVSYSGPLMVRNNVIDADMIYNQSEDVKTTSSYFTKSSVIKYENVDLTNSTGQVQIYAAIPYSNTSVVIRKGSVDGEVIGSAELTYSGLYNHRYHTVDITEVDGVEDIYISFERDYTGDVVTLANVSSINFVYDSSVAFEVSTFEELETALNSGLTNIKLVDDIVFSRVVYLTDDTKLDLNGHTLNTRGYYITKNGSVRERTDLEIMNGHIEGTHINGSIYAADSLYDYAGFNIDIENVSYSGPLMVRNNVIDANMTYNQSEDVKTTSSYFTKSSVIKYENVDLTNSTGQVQIHAAIPYSNTSVVIRKGSVDGEIIGSAELTYSGLYNHRYHTVDITEVDGVEDIYISFERDYTGDVVTLANVSSINFVYDSSVAFEVSTFEELETALNSGLTNIKLVDDIVFSRVIYLTDNTKLDLNGHTLNTRGYYITKNGSVRERTDLEIMNGHIEGTHINGSIYVADSLSDYRGFNIDIENVSYSGPLMVRNNVIGANMTYNQSEDVKTTSSYFTKSSVIKYENVDLTNSTGQVQIHAAIPYSNTSVVIRKGSVDGEVIGSAELAYSGLYNHEYYTVDITEVEGVEDIYISFERDATGDVVTLANVASIDFTLE